jgi:hypothetical protein
LTRPASTEVLTDLLHDFMDGLRAHFTKVSDDGERDLLVDRISPRSPRSPARYWC